MDHLLPPSEHNYRDFFVYVGVPEPIIKSCKMNLDRFTDLFSSRVETHTSMLNMKYDIIRDTRSKMNLMD